MATEPGDGPGQEPRDDMVAKALRLLVRLGDAPQGIGLSALARQAGYPPSTTHRLLSSLAREGFVVTDGERRWMLGLRVFELGQRVSHARGFAGIAIPVMQRVTDATGESTLMAVLEDDEQLYVHFVEGRGQVQITGEPGRRGPLHCTSMGKVLIAFAPPDERRRLVESIALPRLGPNAITDRQAFREEIDRVRACGWASADEEHEAGMLAVGVPILGPDGIAFAALSTAAPAYRSSVADLQTFLPALHAAAAELAVVLPRRRAAP